MARAVAKRSTNKPTSTDVEDAAHDRAHEAHQLRLAGLSWAQVASQTGYLDARVAAMSVAAFLQKVAVAQGPEFRRRALDLELDRLDALQSTYWPHAVGGDARAAELVLKIIMSRSRILGFDRPDPSAEQAERTVVIGGTSEQYIAGLKAVVERTDSDEDQ